MQIRHSSRSLIKLMVLLSGLLFLQACSENKTSSKIDKMTDRSLTWDERLSIAKEFDQIGPQAIPGLIEILEADDSIEETGSFRRPFYVNKALAAEALRSIDPSNDDFIQTMAKMLRSKESKKRSMAALNIEGVGNADVFVPALMDMLGNDEPEERYCAALALGRIGTAAKAAQPLLLTLLEQDPDPDVRGWAASALGDISGDDKKILAALETALNDKDERVRNFAQASLERNHSE